ncbi:MAG: phosphoribosyltransferase family protein [Candidatus Diapherotrites archaeon]|nr:phosphoribosyltransferase family protein [Candidatus Diapherotrites archaeon]
MHTIVTNFSRKVIVPEEGIKLKNEPEPVVRKKYEQEIDRILITKGCLEARITALALEISATFKRIKELDCYVILKGGMFFAADLIRALDEQSDIRTKLDFIKCSSYGNSSKSSGKVDLYKIDELQGENVLLIEDIVDTGKTLKILQEMIGKNAKRFKTCVLLDKGIAKDVQVDFVGFQIPRVFVGGYGLDYAGHYRGLPEIVVIRKELLKK